MIASIFDYGAGNLHSLAKALRSDDVEVRITNDARMAIQADVLILPGVGSFAFAAARLADTRAEVQRAILDGLPTIGICLGMQLLFTRSDEGDGDGLGVFAGSVEKLNSARIPHIGWNRLESVRESVVIDSGLCDVYYANSFVCRANDSADVVAWTTHDGDTFPAMVRRGRVAGVQFHPEKSSEPGVRMLRALLRALVREVAA